VKHEILDELGIVQANPTGKPPHQSFPALSMDQNTLESAWNMVCAPLNTKHMAITSATLAPPPEMACDLFSCQLGPSFNFGL
jgi:hypothetical protein